MRVVEFILLVHFAFAEGLAVLRALMSAVFIISNDSTVALRLLYADFNNLRCIPYSTFAT